MVDVQTGSQAYEGSKQSSRDSQGTDGAPWDRSGELASSRGLTSIADAVVSKIAGIATHEVAGVHALRGGLARVMGALR